jgi:hypothetical protein
MKKMETSSQHDIAYGHGGRIVPSGFGDDSSGSGSKKIAPKECRQTRRLIARRPPGEEFQYGGLIVSTVKLVVRFQNVGRLGVEQVAVGSENEQVG